MSEENPYSLGEYVYEKQLWIDLLGVLLVNYVGLSFYADALRHNFETKSQLDQILIKHGGDINEGFELAMIVHILLLFISYARPCAGVQNVVNTIKDKLSVTLEEKGKIRALSSLMGGVLISIAEIFGINNVPDLKDVPAGLFGAGLFYVLTTKNPYKALKSGGVKKEKGRTKKQKKRK